jgi:hypothetical protein
MIIAYMKLRKRNLGPILDANGWAVNAKAKINVPFGTSLTGIAKLPPNSTVDVHDRYAEKSALWPKFLAVVLIVGWFYLVAYDVGWLYSWTDGKCGKPSEAELAREAKAKAAADTSTPSKNADANAATTASTNAPASTNTPASK